MSLRWCSCSLTAVLLLPLRSCIVRSPLGTVSRRLTGTSTPPDGPPPPSPSASSLSAIPGKVRVRIRGSQGNGIYDRAFSEGDNLMEAIRDDATLPVEVPGSCNGTCQCSTCHVLLHTPEWVRRVEQLFPVTDAEQDCLDKAPGVSEASRLCCQLKLSAALDGIEIDLPGRTVDMRWKAAIRRSTKDS